MAAKMRSAGILLYRNKEEDLQVFIGHPGSPLWAKKDEGFWGIPKGTIDENESPLQAAKREFTEETGLQVPAGELIELGEVEQYGKKIVSAWAIEFEGDTSGAKSGLFKLEWPPRSGNFQEYPELDRLEWFDLQEAALKINKYQIVFLERMAKYLDVSFKRTAQAQQGRLQL